METKTERLSRWLEEYDALDKWRTEVIEERDEHESESGYSYESYDEQMTDINYGLAALADEARDLLDMKEE